MAIKSTRLTCNISICVILSLIHVNASEMIDVHRNMRNESHSHQKIQSGALLPEEGPPKAIVFFFGTLTIAAFIKIFFGRMRIKSLATFLIFVIGGFIGWMAYLFEPVHEYVRDICNMSPKYLYMFFLPILVFRPSYNIDTHLFRKNVKHIVLFCTLGFLISTAVMALIVNSIMQEDWDMMESLIFGIICSTCYAEYTVSILQDIGQSRYLSIIIEGEALLTDASAIVTFNMIIGNILGYLVNPLSTFLIFVIFICASPLLGFIIGKATVCILTVTSHDSISSATITLVVTYLSFYLAEDLVRCSGVLCVMVLGMVLSTERLNIRPELDIFLQQFWELLYFYANSLIFMMTGVLIFEILVKNIKVAATMMSMVVCIMSFICRLLMYVIMNVCTRCCKYNLPWKHVVVAVWGNLRGPVTLCLALVVNKAKGLEEDGEMFLIFSTIMVLTTHLVQGSTLYFVMKSLGMTKISEGRLANMNSAMKYFHITRERSINMIKMDRHLADANWAIVEEGTEIKHPYKIDKASLDDGTDLLLGIRMAYCPDCEKDILAEPTNKEYFEMQKEAYLRILKVRKVSYRNQYEHGVLSKAGVHLLVTAVDVAFHKSLPIMELTDFKTHWTGKKLTGCIRKFIEKFLWLPVNVPRPRNRFRMLCYQLVMYRWFEYVMCAIIVIHAIPICLELYYNPPSRSNAFFDLMISNHVFFCVFTMEAFIKLTAFGVRSYFKDPYNSLDFVICLVSVAHIGYSYHELYHESSHGKEEEYILKKTILAFKILRILKLIRLLKIFLPQSLALIDSIMENHVALNLDVGRGFIAGEEEILKNLPQIIDNKKIYWEIKQKLEVDRLTIAKKLGYIEKEYPELSVTVKTRQAIRIVLNNIGEAVNELKNRGILDDFEYGHCKRMVDKRVKYLQSHYRMMKVSPPHVLMKEIPWIGKQSDVTNFLSERSQSVTFNFDEIMISRGSIPEALYIILYGLVKLIYVPTKETLLNLNLNGALPNVDYFTTLNFEEKQEEYIVGGNVIGELGILTGRPYDFTAKCETPVQALRLTSNDLLEAMNVNSDSNVGLRARMWKSVALRVANVILANTPHYQDTTPEEIKYNLERAYVPDLSQDATLTVTDYIEDVLLIEGQVMDVYSGKVYYAPCCIPRTIQKLYFPRCEGVNIETEILTKLLIIPMKHVHDFSVQADGTNMKFTESFSSRCLHHSVMHSSSKIFGPVSTRSEARDHLPGSHRRGSVTESGRENFQFNPSRDSIIDVEREIQSQSFANEEPRNTISFVADGEEKETKVSVDRKDEEDVRSALSPRILTPNQSSESSNRDNSKSSQQTSAADNDNIQQGSESSENLKENKKKKVENRELPK